MTNGSTQNESKPSLRGLVRYGPDGPAHLRRPSGDVEADQRAIELFRTVTGTDFTDGPYGSHRSSIHVFDDVVLIHVPDDGDGGLVATVENGQRWTVAELVDAAVGAASDG